MIKITGVKLLPKIIECWAICQLDQTGNAIFLMRKRPKSVNDWTCGINRDNIIGMYIEDFNLLYGQTIPTDPDGLEKLFGKDKNVDNYFTYKPFKIKLPLFLDKEGRHIIFSARPI